MKACDSICKWETLNGIISIAGGIILTAGGLAQKGIPTIAFAILAFFKPGGCAVCRASVRAYAIVSHKSCICHIPSFKRRGVSASSSCETVNSYDDYRDNIRLPKDPNEKVNLNTKYISSFDQLFYSIHFENIGNTPAKDIFLFDTLSSYLDLTTLAVIYNGESYNSIDGGESVCFFQRTKEIYIGEILGQKINKTVEETWSIIQIGNNVTFELVNIYLPQNATDHVTFSIHSILSIESGTIIKNKATIRFENLEEIITNEVINIIDDVPPCSEIVSAFVEDDKVVIQWIVNDEIGEYTNTAIYLSVNQSNFTLLVSIDSDQDGELKTEDGLLYNQTSLRFPGIENTTYEFISLSYDEAGNREQKKLIGEVFIKFEYKSIDLVFSTNFFVVLVVTVVVFFFIFLFLLITLIICCFVVTEKHDKY